MIINGFDVIFLDNSVFCGSDDGTQLSLRPVLDNLGGLPVKHYACNLMYRLYSKQESTLPQNNKGFRFELCSSPVAFDIQC